MKKKLILLAGLAIAIAACVESKEGEKAREFSSNSPVIVKEEKARISQDIPNETDTENEEKRETLNSEAEDTSQNVGSLCVGMRKEIFDATNAERINAGLPALIWSDELAEAADVRAGEIITNFSHVRPDGTKCYVLSDLIYGENLARGPQHASGEEFVSRWMGSEAHRENILWSEYTIIGVGTRCTEYGDTAVQLFGCED